MDHTYYHALAISLDREGRIEEALSAIEEALRLNPDGAQIVGTYAHLLTVAGKFDQAEDTIRRALALHRSDGHFHHLLAHLLQRRGEIVAAVQALKIATELAPDVAGFRTKLEALATAAGITLELPQSPAGEGDRPDPAPGTDPATTLPPALNREEAPGPAAPELASRVRIGKDGWLFHRVDDAFGQTCGSGSLSDRNLSRLISLWEVRHAWCGARAIEYRILTVPERHVLYPDKLPEGCEPHPDRPALRLIREAGAIRHAIIYPVAAMRKGREVRDVCYQTDVHWTRYGAYLAYRELLGSLPQCTATIIPKSDLSFSEIRLVGDMTLWLDQRTREVATFADPPKLAVKEILTNRNFKTGQVDVHETENDSLPTLVLFRTSNSTHLIPFLYHHFSRIVAVATTAVYFELLRSEMPDVVISELPERYLAAPHEPRTSDWIRFPPDFNMESFTDVTGIPLPLPASPGAAERREARRRDRERMLTAAAGNHGTCRT